MSVDGKHHIKYADFLAMLYLLKKYSDCLAGKQQPYPIRATSSVKSGGNANTLYSIEPGETGLLGCEVSLTTILPSPALQRMLQ